MNEWGVVGVLVVLIGAFISLVKPIVKLTNTVALNTYAVEVQTETLKANETRNEKDHCELRKEQGEIWDELTDHDKRINCLEIREGK